MLDKPLINHPARFVTSTAVGFADGSGNLSVVSTDAPLPVAATRAAPPPPLQGSASASTLIGPYAPLADAPIHLQLSGTWTGTVTLTRSVDSGTTRQPLTIGGQVWARFTANANEAVWQEGEVAATFYLDIAVTSGTVAYRVSQ